MKLIQLLLQEARKPSIKYKEVEVKKKLEKVVAVLEKNDSGVATRLIRRYERLKKSLEILELRQQALNKDVKEYVTEMFDAEDAVYSRILETVSYTITVSPGTKGADKPAKYETDFEGAYKELVALVPHLIDAVVEIEKKYTKLVSQKDTPEKLYFKEKTKLDEGVVDKIKELFNSLKTWLTKWTKQFDDKFEQIKQKYPA